jgi:hypothetical protein
MLNLMLESLATFDEVIADAGTTRSRGLTLSPGLRTGWDIGEKQVVVGFAVPTLWRDGSRPDCRCRKFSAREGKRQMPIALIAWRDATRGEDS